jgi:uncharacterized protein YbaR (Trm112 family)
MWIRFAETLQCVLCHGSLELTPIEERTADLSREHLEQAERMALNSRDLAAAVDTGLLVCPRCRIWFPVLHGLPILLPYSTPLREEFTSRHPGAVEKLGEGYRCPTESPTVGEEFVLKSFSREWLDYSYDGVLWIWSYEDREAISWRRWGGSPCRPAPRGSWR